MRTSIAFYGLVATLLSPVVLLSRSALAAPSPPGVQQRDFFDIFDDDDDGAKAEDVSLINSVLLFDAPAFKTDPDASTWTAVFRAFIYLRQIDISSFLNQFESVLEGLGLDLGDSVDISTLEERLRHFVAIGLGDKEISVSVDACSAGFVLGETASSGQLLDTIDLGECSGGDPLAEVEVSLLDSRDFNATVYPSAPTGYGIISDIDDTVKITGTLDVLEVIQNQFLKETQEPVAGMPELYAALVEQLQNPQFVYLTGSPFQFYSMFKQFLHDSYPTAVGPVLMQNLSLTDIGEIVDLVTSDPEEFKTEEVAKIHGWYPGKTFVAIGDSTQKDPEVYGAAFREYGAEWVQCIWIRKVDGANNTDTRFAEAFRDVPTQNYRVFSDPAELDVSSVTAGGC